MMTPLLAALRSAPLLSNGLEVSPERLLEDLALPFHQGNGDLCAAAGLCTR